MPLKHMPCWPANVVPRQLASLGAIEDGSVCSPYSSIMSIPHVARRNMGITCVTHMPQRRGEHGPGWSDFIVNQ